MPRTTTKLGTQTVTHGDRIRDFRGNVWTFDYEHDGKVYVKERPHGFVRRVLTGRVAEGEA